jgi:hypothetical protein
MDLDELPVELLLLLATFLHTEADINSVSQTNCRLYSIFNQYLYRNNSRKNDSSALLWAAQNGNVATAQLCIQE